MQTMPKLEFLDGSKEFAYGFECGKLYADLSRGHSAVTGFYHQGNSEQIKLIAQAQGYEITNISKPEMDKSSGFVRITMKLSHLGYARWECPMLISDYPESRDHIDKPSF